MLQKRCAFKPYRIFARKQTGQIPRLQALFSLLFIQRSSTGGFVIGGLLIPAENIQLAQFAKRLAKNPLND